MARGNDPSNSKSSKPEGKQQKDGWTKFKFSPKRIFKDQSSLQAKSLYIIRAVTYLYQSTPQVNLSFYPISTQKSILKIEKNSRFSVQRRCSKMHSNSDLYLFCPLKYKKKIKSKIEYFSKSCRNFQYCFDGPNLKFCLMKIAHRATYYKDFVCTSTSTFA